MTSPTFPALAESVVADGFAAHWEEVAELIATARQHHVNRTLIDIVADRDAPTVTRERAFGQILVHLSSQTGPATMESTPVESDSGLHFLKHGRTPEPVLV